MQEICRQKSIFCVITLLVVAILLLFHTLFSSILGRPSLPVIVLLALALILAVIELMWLHNMGPGLTEKAVRVESAFSIAVAFGLAALLTYITNRDESPYFILLAIPILQCAYVFGLFFTLLTIAAADGMCTTGGMTARG